jgi:hypothetical protein
MRSLMLELRVAVGVETAFPDFDIGLQAVAFLLEQLANELMADTKALRLQFGGQVTDALGCPTQRVLGIAARDRFDQGQEAGEQLGVLVGGFLASASRRTNSPCSRHPGTRRADSQLPPADGNGAPRNARGTFHRDRPAKAQGLRLGGGPKAA